MKYVSYIAKATGHSFKDTKLLKTALTHSSYANEKNSSVYNERLEFLGDSVLSLIVSDFLYNYRPRLAEGEMSKTRAILVCERSLASCAAVLGLSEYLFLGKGEELTGGRERPSILADAVEALIAALYIDAGFEKARGFVLKILEPQLADVLSGNYITDYKTAFQEKVQSKLRDKPEYMLLGEEGPDHNKVFRVGVALNNVLLAKGEGKSKKDAEQAAAKNALEAPLPEDV